MLKWPGLNRKLHWSCSAVFATTWTTAAWACPKFLCACAIAISQAASSTVSQWLLVTTEECKGYIYCANLVFCCWMNKRSLAPHLISSFETSACVRLPFSLERNPCVREADPGLSGRPWSWRVFSRRELRPRTRPSGTNDARSIVFAALPLCSPRFTHAARGETDHRTTLHEQRSVGFNKPVSPRPGWNAANANACQEMYDITVLRCFRRRGAETSRSLQPPTYTRLQTFAQCKASVPLQGNRLAIGQVFIVLEKLLSFARCCSVMLLRKKSLPPKFWPRATSCFKELGSF